MKRQQAKYMRWY